MQRMFGRTAIWIVLTVAIASLSMAVPQELPEGEGKKLLEERCASCHSLKPVVSLKQSQGAWKDMSGQIEPGKTFSLTYALLDLAF